MAKRALAATITARIECSVDGDEWTVINGGLRDKILKFKFGEEVDDETPDGRKVKVLNYSGGAQSSPEISINFNISISFSRLFSL